MPKRTPVDRDAVLKTYDETKNAQEVARLMGIHPNTVYAALRGARGLCTAGCAQKAERGKVYCKKHGAYYAKRAQAHRAERRRLGLCFYCDERVDTPLSRQFCAQHRLANIDHMRELAEKRRTEKPVKSSVTLDKREREIKHVYRGGGLEAWHRDGHSCVICGVSYDEARINMHHIDLNRKNNAAENFACLCHDCHELVHRLLRSDTPEKVIAWTRRTYPGMNPPGGHDADMAFVTANQERQGTPLLTPTGRTA